MKKTSKRLIGLGVVATRKAISSSPRLKSSLKRVIETQLGSDKSKSRHQIWLEKNLPDFIAIEALKKEHNSLKSRPLISVVVPVYNTGHVHLRECIESVKAQVYQNWELLLVDDHSPDKKVREIIKEYSDLDSRIKAIFLSKNLHISGATNTGIKQSSGSFISLLDHDDILWPNALLEVAKVINSNKRVDFIYTDEDKITNNRHEHLGAFFKPDWNPDFLRSVNYITHFSTIRTDFLEKVGYFRSEFDGAQDWDLFLRVTEKTKNIYHIPKVVYSWRIHDLSTAKDTSAKPYVVEAQRRALTEDASKRGYPDAIVEQDKNHSGYWRVNYPVKNSPLISIIIPSKNQYKVLKRCIDSIYAKTTYSNFEIILVDTGSTEKAVHKYYKKIQARHPNFKLVNWPEQPFSYARSCNKGAEEAKGDLLLMLNNDTEVITENWLEIMAGDAQRKEIGAVGCLLFFPDKYHIQHAGVGVGLGGVAANSFSMMTLQQKMTQTQHLMLNTKHDMTVVTAACMMLRKDLFKQVDGFSEDFRVTYNDVDLCLRIYELGLQNLYTPYVRLIHHESISIGNPTELKKRDTQEFKKAKNLFIERWEKYVLHDPNINQNLSKKNAFYDI